ncbi:5856_t:CDS:2, partial [Racocetra fulgida]
CDYGTWALEMASDYPNSHFIGVDVTPIFPSAVTKPNVRFLQCNVLDGLPFDSNTFDFVLVRLFGNTFTERDWEDKIINEIVRLTKPGGPVGSWGHRAGELGASYARQLSGKVKPWVISYLDITEEEYNEMMIKAEQEFNIHRTYASTHRYVGQKIISS